MRTALHARWANLLVFAFLLACTTSFAGDSAAQIGTAFPVGSTTYFVVLTTWEDASPDVCLVPATDRTTRQIQRTLDGRKRTADAPSPLGVHVHHFHAIVWSNGQIEMSPLWPTNQGALDTIIARLEAQKDQEHAAVIQIPTSSATSSTSTPTYAPGCQCHARTADGTRCTRTAKGDTGFCWQHQNAPDAYPDKD